MLKSYFCIHEYEQIGVHSIINSILYKCKNCGVFYYFNLNIGIGYKRKEPGKLFLLFSNNEEFKTFDRLQRIRKYAIQSNRNEVVTIILNEDINWLIEQAKKVKLLEKQLDTKIVFVNNGWEEERYVIQEENERLKTTIKSLKEK